MVSVISSSRRVMAQARAVQGKETELLPDPTTPSQIWEDAMREKRRREQQRQRMVNWRRLKKEKMADMLYERRVLEKELQLQVMEARVRLDRMQVGSLATAYRQSLVECAALTSENIALREAIEHQTSIKTQLERETDAFLGQLRPVDPPPSLSNDETGWCVQFPNNEPSLYFTPFTRAEFEAIVSRNDIAVSHPALQRSGRFLAGRFITPR